LSHSNIVTKTYHTQNIVPETYDKNIVSVFLWKPRQNISLALFDHVSHTIFEDKTHNPSFVVVDNHSTNSKWLKCFVV
jgi:hypothetical protein